MKICKRMCKRFWVRLPTIVRRRITNWETRPCQGRTTLSMRNSHWACEHRQRSKSKTMPMVRIAKQLLNASTRWMGLMISWVYRSQHCHQLHRVSAIMNPSIAWSKNLLEFQFAGNRNRYRTPITSASVFDTLLEGPKMSFAILGSDESNRTSSTSESSSTESLRNGLYFSNKNLCLLQVFTQSNSLID